MRFYVLADFGGPANKSKKRLRKGLDPQGDPVPASQTKPAPKPAAATDKSQPARARGRARAVAASAAAAQHAPSNAASRDSDTAESGSKQDTDSSNPTTDSNMTSDPLEASQGSDSGGDGSEGGIDSESASESSSESSSGLRQDSDVVIIDNSDNEGSPAGHKPAKKRTRFSARKQHVRKRAARARHAAGAGDGSDNDAGESDSGAESEEMEFGPYFEHAGVRVPVPAQWPVAMVNTSQHVSKALGAIMQDVAGVAPTLARRPGQKEGYLTRSGGTLASEGKRMLLTVKARVLALKARHPSVYKEVSR